MSYDWLTENRQRHRRKWTDKTTSCVEYSDVTQEHKNSDWSSLQISIGSSRRRLPVPLGKTTTRVRIPGPSVTSFHVSAQQSSLSAESITLSGLACSRPKWNLIPNPAILLCIVAASTCFVRKSASISLVGFLQSEILPSVTIACTQRNTVSMPFHTSEPSSAPNRNSSSAVHPHMSLEFPSPVW